MIIHINDLLNRWAEWSTRRASSAMGYPKQCIYTRLSGRSPQLAAVPDMDEDSWAIEQAVVALKKNNQHQHKVIVEMYLKGGTSEQKATALACHRDTMYARLHRAHISIMNHLNESA